ncbi:hypothetical protein [Mucilaginibacter phyllosphaerae]|uniref:hypothetical protein n=1 Tax=Mucilaginibacter phyllosphaerae TaxID=1812349 RepID=UPI001E36004A|nr:hypothetical protein [Mucilaginibacter phyllosphaerae]
MGVKNDLNIRLDQHKENRGAAKSFSGKYYSYNLFYYEHFSNIDTPLHVKKRSRNGEEKRKML